MSQHRSVALAALFTLFALLPGCVDTGSSEIVIPLEARGTNPGTEFVGRDGWTIALDEASLAFGPLTLCAGATAGELCDTAHAEWLDSAVVDVLDPKPRALGEIIGVSGRVRSWMYDLGFVSTLTQDEPLELPAAKRLQGNSVHLRGKATNEALKLTFEIALPIRQEAATERGVPVIAKNTAEPFDQDLTNTPVTLQASFDAAPWFEQVDFEALAKAHDCNPTCPNPIQITPNDQAYRAIRVAILAANHAKFTWTH
jgi:hypothetical protein